MGDVFDEPDGLEEWKKKGARCKFGCEVPFEDKEIYEETRMCRFCRRMQKNQIGI